MQTGFLLGNKAKGTPVEIGISAGDSCGKSLTHDLDGRHGDAVVFCFGKGQANILERERHDESRRIGLTDNLVAVNSMYPAAKHRARHDVEERLGIEPPLD